MKHPKLFLAMALAAVTILSSCRRPYDTPEFVTIEPNETAFVFPLEGETGDQTKFESAKLLAERKVAAKRVEIPHRWQPTGRWENTEGQYLPIVRVVTVNRQPESRTWGSKDAGSRKGVDDSIAIESKDSVGFSSGWTCTAQVLEEDTPVFLYQYAGAPLATVMDNEVHDRIQSRAGEFAAQYDLDELRAKKKEMLEHVRDGTQPAEANTADASKIALMGVVPYFKTKGITITNIGMFEGFTYDNPQIQAAIDKVFQAQQDKEVALAEAAAQEQRNKAIELAATAAALKLTIEAEGKAKAIELETAALTKAQNTPLYAQKLLLEKWDGSYPRFFSGGIGSSPSLLLSVPDLNATK